MMLHHEEQPGMPLGAAESTSNWTDPADRTDPSSAPDYQGSTARNRRAWGVLGGLIVLAGARRGGPAGALLGVTGAALGLAGPSIAKRLRGSVRPSEPAHVERAVTIQRPADELYACWRDLPNHQNFTPGLENVREQDGHNSDWKVKPPVGPAIQWHSEITEERPGERIAWRSQLPLGIAADGLVTFRPAPADRGTIVNASLTADSKLAATDLTRPLVERVLDQSLGLILARFKQTVEAGEVATAGNRRVTG